MGFSKSKATSVLQDLLKSGNTIALLSAVNTEAETYTEVSGTGYSRYTISSGDFSASGGVITTAKNILFGLAEGTGWGTAVGIAVFSGSTLQYLAELTESKAIGADTVPVFKKYNATTGEGIRITLDVVTAAVSVSETG